MWGQNENLVFPPRSYAGWKLPELLAPDDVALKSLPHIDAILRACIMNIDRLPVCKQGLLKIRKLRPFAATGIWYKK